MNANTIVNTSDQAFTLFIGHAQDLINTRWTAQGYTHAKPPKLVVKAEGARYIQVDRVDDGGAASSRSVHCFIDRTGGMVKGAATKAGDILKAASYKTPAKHARGSIFAADFGMSCMGDYGPNYLK